MSRRDKGVSLPRGVKLYHTRAGRRRTLGLEQERRVFTFALEDAQDVTKVSEKRVREKKKRSRTYLKKLMNWSLRIRLLFRIV